MKHAFKTWFSIVTTLAVLLALTSATYAWFTTNRAVSTSVASARTGEENLELQVSTDGGENFQSVDEATIRQINGTDTNQLMPVSTADLNVFVSSPVTSGNIADIFRKVENESGYYHGRIYLRAVGDGFTGRMNLYLDETDGLPGENVSGTLLNASRLGLRFGDDSGTTVILRLSEASNTVENQISNTQIGGQLLGDGQVLTWQDGMAAAVADPSVPIDTYTVSFANGQTKIPDQPLLKMEFGKIYPLDVYFYLEGCDPDCSNAVQFNVADLHLAFYGLLSQEAD